MAKKENPSADTSALEKKIDEIVYKLYGLTEEEIAIVEGRSAGGRPSPASTTPDAVRNPARVRTGASTRQPSILDEDTDID